eukprot:CAMPEP_0198303994 /NCGR_PEP_ID=MMETSP1449-20131203/57175_1 /TAXON_ID=420275 /ORGANISM="Attheya septentrionalis, Strain CCMP2084" /LENGTH=58 /DNA_ID=CAMNT_0044006505 /DNA_START=1176 /DNA_END=1352 /DNA_ORIENTATION=-
MTNVKEYCGNNDKWRDEKKTYNVYGQEDSQKYWICGSHDLQGSSLGKNVIAIIDHYGV